MIQLRIAGLLALAGSALLCAETRAQLSQHVFSGTAPQGHFGRAVASAGDVDHDGVPDILVGEAGDTDFGANSGSAYVYSGKDWSLLLSLHGAAVNEQFGYAVAGLGDVNGDGHGDVAISALGTDVNGTDTGSVQVFSGLTGSKLYTVNGTKSKESFGFSIAGVGDVTGDGRPDFVVGAPDYESSALVPLAGRARLIDGATGVVLNTFYGSANQRMGWCVAAAGDVNGDGKPDFVVGVPGDQSLGDLTGRVEVRSGVDGSVLYSRYGAGELTLFGTAIAGLGDFDHDGFADIAVGAYSENGGRGSVRVFRGPAGAASWVFTGDAMSDQFGVVLDVAGDVDKDGTPDLLVGSAPLTPGKPSFARVLSLATGAALLPDMTGQLGDSFGTALSHLGDVTGDGWPEMLIGAPYATQANGKQGTVSVISPLVCQADLGFGGPGVSKLSLCGTTLGPGGKADLLLKNAPANRPALLAVSLQAASLPFKGGTLVPDLGLGAAFTLTTNAQGKVLIPGVPGGLGAFDVLLQVIVQDPAQPKGVGISNVVSAHFMP